MSKERAAQLIEAGVWLKLSGDLEGARKLFERALQLDPDNARVQELVAATTGPVVSRPSSVGTSSNPFERPPEGQTAGDVDWGGATGFGPPVSPPVARPPAAAVAAPPPKQEPLEDDWGTLTGAAEELSPSQTNAANAAPMSSSPSGMTVTITGTAGPEAFDRSTPPIFESPTLGRSTPPQFADGPALSAAGHDDEELSADVSSQSGLGTNNVSGLRALAPPPAPSEIFPVAPPPLVTDNAWSWDNPTDNRIPRPVFTTQTPIPQAAPKFSSSPSGLSGLSAQPAQSSGSGLRGQPSEASDFDVAIDLDPPPATSSTPAPTKLAEFAESAWDAQSNPGIKLSSPQSESMLELVVPKSSPSSPDIKKGEVKTLLRGARDLLDLDDHTGAMELILKAQSVAPDDSEATALRARSERTLLAMFESKIGNLNATPRVMLKDDEIIWLNLDHRAGFVLAQIDGTVTFDDVFSVSGMSRLDTARIIAQLIDEGVVSRG